MLWKLSTALFAVLFVLAVTPVAYAGSGKGSSLDPKILGSTYGEWAAEWWIWATAGPDGENAVQDTTGEFCGANQPDGKVWFLAGTFGEADVERDCTIPADKALFYPLLNSVWIDCPDTADEDLTDTEVRAIMAEFGGGGNNACRLTSTIDGEDVFGGFLTSNAISTLQILDVRTQSPVFSIPLPENHVFGGLCADPVLPSGETGRSIAEGHWVMAPPLPPGEHELTLHGADCGDFPFEVGVTYHLTVLDDDDD
jgi:hypothetical protein